MVDDDPTDRVAMLQTAARELTYSAAAAQIEGRPEVAAELRCQAQQLQTAATTGKGSPA
jgi:hypothetical protein